jgi:hypothetical protein
MPKNKIVKKRTAEEVKTLVLDSGTGFDAKHVFIKAAEELEDFKDTKQIGSDTYLYKSMTLYEFDKGVLLVNALPELYRVFALEFSKNLQSDYKCIDQGEKSLAEVVALNFVRTIYMQDRITAYLAMRSINDVGVKYLDFVSRELDRAQRHYLGSLQALRTLHNPSFEVNIRANTALVGQNQAIQVKNP